MQIVQISDLHVGGLFKQNTFDDIVNEINNELRPDAIIISGDLVDEGIIYQYKTAQKEIQRFDCPNIIILPGNHDYRHTGYQKAASKRRQLRTAPLKDSCSLCRRYSLQWHRVRVHKQCYIAFPIYLGRQEYHTRHQLGTYADHTARPDKPPST